jgi:hypothetical protein
MHLENIDLNLNLLRQQNILSIFFVYTTNTIAFATS